MSLDYTTTIKYAFPYNNVDTDYLTLCSSQFYRQGCCPRVRLNPPSGAGSTLGHLNSAEIHKGITENLLRNSALACLPNTAFSKLCFKNYSASSLIQAHHLNDGTVPSCSLHLCCDNVGRPVCQPVVNGNHEGMLKELGQEQQAEQEESGRRQVCATGAPWDSGPLTHHLR